MEEKRTEIEDEINLLDYLIVILKRKKLIFSMTLSFAFVVGILVFILPNKYVAEARFLPPQDTTSSIASAMLGQLGGLSSVAGSALGLKSPNDMYIGLLNSRTVLDRIIDRFDLMKRYNKNLVFPFYREDAREKLVEDVLVATNDANSGLVTVSVEDKDPKIAADMANAFIDELIRLNRGLALADVARRRLFYEEQLKGVKGTLVKAEDELRRFQEKTGVLQVDAQAQAVIEGDAELRAQIAAKEVELKVMKTYMTVQNPDMQKVEESLRGMKLQLAKIEAKNGAGADPLMPMGRMPSVGVEYVRKLRDLKFNETLYELLLKQFELSKMDEARDASVIQVVDRAVVPEKAAKPKRILLIAAAGFVGFFFAVITAFVLEFKEKASNDRGYRERITLLRSYARLRNRE